MVRTAALLVPLLLVAPVRAQPLEAADAPTMALGLRGGGGFEFDNHGPVAAWSATGQGLVAFYLTPYLSLGALLQHHFFTDMDGICGSHCTEYETVADLVVAFDLPVQNSDVWSFKMAVGTGYRRHVKEVSGPQGYVWTNQGLDLLRFDVAAEYAVTQWLRVGPWFTWSTGVFLSGEKVFNDKSTRPISTEWGVPDLLSIQLGLSAGFVL